MEAAARALGYARSRRDVTLRRLITLLGYPTVSADPRHTADMNACAAGLARLLTRIGLRDARVHLGRAAGMRHHAGVRALRRPARRAAPGLGHRPVPRYASR